jgi:hypothetical protein
MPDDFDPAFESDEGKIGPKNRNQAIKEKNRQPAVVSDDFR